MTDEADCRSAVTRLNDDLDQRVVSNVAQAIWLPSPAPGVDRRMLDRNGGSSGGRSAAAASTVIPAADKAKRL